MATILHIQYIGGFGSGQGQCQQVRSYMSVVSGRRKWSVGSGKSSYTFIMEDWIVVSGPMSVVSVKHLVHNIHHRSLGKHLELLGRCYVIKY